MAQWLNKRFGFLILFVFTIGFSFAQMGVETPVYKDYKDPEQFESFRKKRIIVAAWQINTLKDEGALVVKLKTNNILIDELTKSGHKELALEKQLEQFATNRNIMFAYRDNFTFCKLYFIYSTSTDTLLKGAREGVFLDTNLLVDPSIVMSEKFYLIADRDFAYTSSIGFVKEDSARFVKEEGNPVKLMAIVLKNKYGHQLKNPMPYAIKGINLSNTNFSFPIKYKLTSSGAADIQFPVNRTYFEDRKNKIQQPVILKKEEDFIMSSVKLKKEVSYELLSITVYHLNFELNEVLKNYRKPDINRIRADIKPFLY